MNEGVGSIGQMQARLEESRFFRLWKAGPVSATAVLLPHDRTACGADVVENFLIEQHPKRAYDAWRSSRRVGAPPGLQNPLIRAAASWCVFNDYLAESLAQKVFSIPGS